MTGGTETATPARFTAADVQPEPHRSPGSRDFAVNLPPGRWAFICFLIEDSGLSYAKAGMATEFRVA